MVCIRCKLLVKEELKKMGVHTLCVSLGEVEILENISQLQIEEFRSALSKSGLELLDDKKAVLIEKVKSAIIELVHYIDEPINVKLSVYLSEKLEHDYTYLANLFSAVQGTTIEKFYITHRIERVKELLIYNELNLTEIAWQMQYSSVAHLSAQFKKVTGLTPTFYKNLKENRRSMLENL